MTENVCDPKEPPDPTKRRCYDCAHMKGAVSWWCMNPEAIEYRGTRIPGIRDCIFWSPARVRVPILQRIKNIFTRTT